MPRLTRAALVAALVLAPSVFACTYTAKGKVYVPGVRAYRFRIVNAPCPEVAPPPQVYVAAAPPPVYVPVPMPPPAYAPAPVAPPVYVPSPMPPPTYYSPAPLPPPTYVPAPVVVAQAPVRHEDEGPSHFGIKYMPGISTAVGFANGPQTGTVGFSQSLGLELRLSRWFALRSDYELRPEGRSWDMLGLKVWLIPSWVIKPYASASVAGSESYNLPGKFQLGLSAAVGADLMIGRHFFIEAEARYRVSPGVGDCCREVPHLTALVGGGVAFF